jgi:GNAT superfamily N-acetyltransferase
VGDLTLTSVNPSPDEVQYLEDRIYEFNSRATGMADGEMLAFFVRDGDRIVAGICGNMWGGTCELRQFWVEESRRHCGVGRRLFEAAEKEARRREQEAREKIERRHRQARERAEVRRRARQAAKEELRSIVKAWTDAFALDAFFNNSRAALGRSSATSARIWRRGSIGARWVLSLPYRLRYVLAWDHDLCCAVVAVYVRAVRGFLRRRAQRDGIADGRDGAVAVIQRFGGALNLNVHIHALVMDWP